MPIHLKPRDRPDYPEDCKRIAQVVFENGYHCSEVEAELLWREYSDSVCAGWIILPKEDRDIWAVARNFISPVAPWKHE